MDRPPRPTPRRGLVCRRSSRPSRRCGPRLVTFRGERGGELFDLPDAPRPPVDTPAPVRLLPEWDSVIVTRADARLLPLQHRSSVFQPGLRVLPTVFVDGTVAGTWKIECRRTAAVADRVALCESAARRCVAKSESEAHALLAFAGTGRRDPTSEDRLRRVRAPAEEVRPPGIMAVLGPVQSGTMDRLRPEYSLRADKDPWGSAPNKNESCQIYTSWVILMAAPDY